MIFEKRQERLKRFVGGNQCLTVFAVLQESNVQNREHFPSDEFDRLASQHGIELEKGDNFSLPHLKLGKHNEHGGYIFHASNGAKLIEQKKLTPLYSISPYSMVDDHIERGTAALDMYFIKSLYMSKIFEQFDGFEYTDEDDFLYECDDFNIRFGYIVQPYDPSVCHPNDLGKLQTLKMPGDALIVPDVEALNSSRELRSSHLRDKSFSLYL